MISEVLAATGWLVLGLTLGRYLFLADCDGEINWDRARYWIRRIPGRLRFGGWRAHHPDWKRRRRAEDFSGWVYARFGGAISVYPGGSKKGSTTRLVKEAVRENLMTVWRFSDALGGFGGQGSGYIALVPSRTPHRDWIPVPASEVKAWPL